MPSKKREGISIKDSNTSFKHSNLFSGSGRKMPVSILKSPRVTPLSASRHFHLCIGVKLQGICLDNLGKIPRCFGKTQEKVVMFSHHFFDSYGHVGVSKNRGTPNGWFRMEIPIKLDDLGVPPFSETPISMSQNKSCIGTWWLSLENSFETLLLSWPQWPSSHEQLQSCHHPCPRQQMWYELDSAASGATWMNKLIIASCPQEMQTDTWKTEWKSHLTQRLEMWHHREWYVKASGSPRSFFFSSCQT